MADDEKHDEELDNRTDEQIIQDKLAEAEEDEAQPEEDESEEDEKPAE